MSPGPLLLQGGAEMQPACREMDLDLAGLAPDGPVVVLLGAATPGADHDRAAARAQGYYRGLLPTRQVRVAPHPEVDLSGCLASIGEAALLVLPGGSPSRLLDALRADGARLGALLVRLHQDGAALSGASAGAMVLCARTVLPDRLREGRPLVVDGLGLAPGLSLVHDDGGDRGWSDPDDPDGVRWGLPEAGGVLLHGGTVLAVGQGRPRLVLGGAQRTLDRRPQPLAGVLRR